MSVQLIFSLSGTLFGINSAECCHTQKMSSANHSCCSVEMNNMPEECTSDSYLLPSRLHSDCGCIHAAVKNNPDFTIQNSFELQKGNSVSVFYPSVNFEYTSLNFQTKKKTEKEHGPPLFLLDATFRI